MSIPHPTAREPDPDSLVVARIPWISLIILLLMAGVMYFLDEVVSMGFKVFDPPGDVDQELEALQQFGQFGSLVLVAIIVCRLQPPPIRPPITTSTSMYVEIRPHVWPSALVWSTFAL